MQKIGLTGGIASGKSAAAEIMKQRGAYIIDADKIAHEITDRGTHGAKLIEDAFGSNFFENGILNRAMLRDYVHGSAYKIALLNSLLHPLIKTEIQKRMSYAIGAKAMVVVAPLLFECELESLFNVIITISCSEQTRIERAAKRDNMNVESVKAILKHQLTDAEREKGSHIIIYNNRTLDDFLREVGKVYENLTK